jgi:hypothetical protein
MYSRFCTWFPRTSTLDHSASILIHGYIADGFSGDFSFHETEHMQTSTPHFDHINTVISDLEHNE